MTRVDDLKARMLQEFEDGGEPDIAEYVRAAPEARTILLDYWVLLIGSPRLSELGLDGKRSAPKLDTIERDAVRDLCLAVSLGPEWLKRATNEREVKLASLGAEMERVRAAASEIGGRAPNSFRRTAVYGWIAGLLGGDEGRGVSRMSVQKVAYLLEHGLDLGVFRKHGKYRFGPYDPSLTYRDAEPLCLKKGYLLRGPDNLLLPGPEHSHAAKYAIRYVRQGTVARALVDELGTLGESRLETLTTVHSVGLQTRNDGDVTVEQILEVIGSDDVWRSKLNRRNFTAEKIREALGTLSLLRLI